MRNERMKAFIHMGLHKTGSTLVQYLAALNAKALVKAGVYFKPNLGYPAHHAVSARVLTGDFRDFRRMARDASGVGAQTLFVSSENFENLLFEPAVTHSLIDTLRGLGCGEIVFALYVRDPVETFWSLYAEHSRHVPIDAVEMMRFSLAHGFYAVEPSLNSEARRRRWRFCFDHARFVGQFTETLAAMPGTRLRVYDFHSFVRFPGDEMFRDMGVEGAITRRPRRMVVNPLLPPKTVRANFKRHFERCGVQALPSFLGLDETSELRRRARMSELLQARFAGTNARLFAALAEAPPVADDAELLRA
jgi:hypothetical protein